MNKKLTFQEKTAVIIRKNLPEEQDRKEFEAMASQAGKFREQGDQAIKTKNGKIYVSEVAWGQAVFPLCGVELNLLESIAGGIQDIKDIDIEEINRLAALAKENKRAYEELKGPSKNLSIEQKKEKSKELANAKKIWLEKTKKLNQKAISGSPEYKQLSVELSQVKLQIRALRLWVNTTFPYNPESVPSYMNTTLNQGKYSLLDQINHVDVAIKDRARKIADHYNEKLDGKDVKEV